ncbi:tetratricopeptide repeat protein [Persephonella sp.]
MSLTGKFLSKKREEVESDVADIHPFSRVKPKKRKNIIISLLIITTVVVYSLIFLFEVFDKEKNEDIKTVATKENMKNETGTVKEVEEIIKQKKPELNININELNSSIEKNILSIKKLSDIQGKPEFKKIKTEITKKTEKSSKEVPVAKKELNKRELMLSYIKKGKNAEKRNDLKSAIYFYKKAWKLDKKNSNLIYKIADLHYRTGYYRATVKYSDMVLRLKPDYIPALILKAKAYHKLGMKEKSKALLEEAYFQYPENVNIIYNLADIYEKERSYIIARDLYKILDDMGYIKGSLKLASVNEKLGYKDEAYKIYKRLLSNPDLPPEIKYRIEEKILLLGD